MNVMWLIFGVVVGLFRSEQKPQRRSIPEGEKSNSTNSKLRWNEYKLHFDLYKFYLNFGLKANVFFYVITGAIVTVIYSPGRTVPLQASALRVLLVTPFIISMVLAGAFWSGAVWWWRVGRRFNKKAVRTDLGLEVPPFFHFLTVLLLIFGFIFIMIATFLCDMMEQHGVSFWLCRCLPSM